MVCIAYRSMDRMVGFIPNLSAAFYYKKLGEYHAVSKDDFVTGRISIHKEIRNNKAL